MGIAGSPDIFQGKMLELIESLEYVSANLDYLLVWCTPWWIKNL
jgi:hypothetical protein